MNRNPTILLLTILLAQTAILAAKSRLRQQKISRVMALCIGKFHDRVAKNLHASVIELLKNILKANDAATAMLNSKPLSSSKACQASASREYVAEEVIRLARPL